APAGIAALNAVVAFDYCARVVQWVWMVPAPDVLVLERGPRRVGPSLALAFGMLAVAVIVVGVFPEAVGQFAKAASAIAGG
ncbi:MAG: hypothetical protein GY778_21270, partial [bacterium]|nr:hypothetical protein [bacterium]